MNSYQEQFQNDFIKGMTSLIGKTWLRMTGAYGIFYGVLLLVIAVIAGFAYITLDLSGFMPLLEELNSEPSPTEMMGILEDFGAMFMTPGMFIMFGIYMTITFFLSAWHYNLAFMVADDTVREEENSFSELFKRSFNSNVFKLLGAYFLLSTIWIIGLFLAILAAKISGLITFLLGCALTISMLRFVLVMPALAHEERTIMEAIKFSVDHIDFVKALKIFGIIMVAGISLGLLILFVAMVVGFISLIPVLGQIIQFAFNVFLGGFMLAITVSALSGLYLFYADPIGGSQEEVHDGEMIY